MDMDINIEAILVIGLLCLLMGVLLYIPGRLWAKHKIKKNPNGAHSMHITRAGLVFISALLVVLFGGLFSPYFMPNTFMSKLVSTHIGRLIYALVVAAIATPCQRSLEARGFKLFVRKEAKSA